MRLLNTDTLIVQEFFDDTIPPYAILSHTWGDEEVTFQEMLGTVPTHKLGFQKLLNSCKQAKRNNLKYIWIDTCCIDKTSSAELSEAINSMYRWYQKSKICYIYLSDVLETTGIEQEDSEFRRSKWFTRGWTLQELIAPMARKLPEIQALLSDVTDINVDIIHGVALSGPSVAQRMSWAASRQTTRTEDIAYCLMGIFNVNMPLLYGEGQKAFQRLQEEILKGSDDKSIFAHNSSKNRILVDSSAILAQSPASFSGWGNVKMHRSLSTEVDASSFPPTMTSRGLRIRLPLCRNSEIFFAEELCLGLLDCHVGGDDLTRLAIPLRPVRASKDLFYRVRGDWLAVLIPGQAGPGIASVATYQNGTPSEVAGFHLDSDDSSWSVHTGNFRVETIYVMTQDSFHDSARLQVPDFHLKAVFEPAGSSLVLVDAYPSVCWNSKTRHLLGLEAGFLYGHRVYGVLHFRDEEIGFNLVVVLGCTHETKTPPDRYAHGVFKHWYRVSSSGHDSEHWSEGRGPDLEKSFHDAEERELMLHSPHEAIDWIGSLVAKITIETVEFLGRHRFELQIEIS